MLPLLLFSFPFCFLSLSRGCVSFSLAGGSRRACRFHSFGENDDAETEYIVDIRGAFILSEHLRKASAVSNALKMRCRRSCSSMLRERDAHS